MTPQERAWDVVPGYEPLAEVFQTALNQSQKGKGKERHANDKPFLQQPIAEIGRMVGIGYNVGQAMKKGQEAMRLPDDRAQAELLGAMVYLASAYLLIGERTQETARAAFTPVQEKIDIADMPNGSVVYSPSTPVQEEVGDLDGLMPREYPFAFPPALKWMGKSALDYVTKLREEVKEVAEAARIEDAVEEMFDVIHVAETGIRTLCEYAGLDAGAIRDEVEKKNRARRYYEPQG